MKVFRSVIERTRGEQRGPIRRMISPAGLGGHLKPFVFLDFIHTTVSDGWGFGFHPHSGIATLTYHHDANVEYEDTSGQSGLIMAGGLEWMRAGGGVWHTGTIRTTGHTTGFQLWVALPPGIEDGSSEGQYLPPDKVDSVGNTKVLLGRYEGAASLIRTPTPLNYFDIGLSESDRWCFETPADHSVAWVFVYEGLVRIGGVDLRDELAVLDQTAAPVEIKSLANSRALFGSGPRHDYPLILGPSSVHTNEASLKNGTHRIRQIAAKLQAHGRLHAD
jgi:redox-sensitive bicupin YhaK (pirin superfamily)